MELIADILLIAGASAAGLYCFVLSRRLSKFTNLETGVGGAISTLSTQVDDMTKALEKAHEAAGTSTLSLDTSTERAEAVAKRLELLVASMHDLPDVPQRETEIGPDAEQETEVEEARSEAEAQFLRSRRAYQEAAE